MRIVTEVVRSSDITRRSARSQLDLGQVTELAEKWHNLVPHVRDIFGASLSSIRQGAVQLDINLEAVSLSKKLNEAEDILDQQTLRHCLKNVMQLLDLSSQSDLQGTGDFRELDNISILEAHQIYYVSQLQECFNAMTEQVSKVVNIKNLLTDIMEGRDINQVSSGIVELENKLNGFIKKFSESWRSDAIESIISGLQDCAKAWDNCYHSITSALDELRDRAVSEASIDPFSRMQETAKANVERLIGSTEKGLSELWPIHKRDDSYYGAFPLGAASNEAQHISCIELSKEERDVLKLVSIYETHTNAVQISKGVQISNQDFEDYLLEVGQSLGYRAANNALQALYDNKFIDLECFEGVGLSLSLMYQDSEKVESIEAVHEAVVESLEEGDSVKAESECNCAIALASPSNEVDRFKQATSNDSGSLNGVAVSDPTLAQLQEHQNASWIDTLQLADEFKNKARVHLEEILPKIKTEKREKFERRFEASLRTLSILRRRLEPDDFERRYYDILVNASTPAQLTAQQKKLNRMLHQGQGKDRDKKKAAVSGIDREERKYKAELSRLANEARENLKNIGINPNVVVKAIEGFRVISSPKKIGRHILFCDERVLRRKIIASLSQVDKPDTQDTINYLLRNGVMEKKRQGAQVKLCLVPITNISDPDLRILFLWTLYNELSDKTRYPLTKN